MDEYYYILSLYTKQKKYYWKLAIVCIFILLITSVFSSLNLVRLNIFWFYMLGMIVAIKYANKTYLRSKNYHKLHGFIEEYKQDLIQNSEIIFFMDYQLTTYFHEETTELFELIGNKNNQKEVELLSEIIDEIKKYYDSLIDENNLEEKVDATLDWYKLTVEKRKNNLV